MRDLATAADRLQRLLYILPAAAREEGARLQDLADALDVSVATVMDDITEVMARSFYHPAGSGEDIQIHLGAERVQVWTGGSFRRPVRLSPREALALAVGLRGMRLEGGRDTGGEGAGDGAEDLLHRLETHLTTVSTGDGDAEHVLVSDLMPDPRRIREDLVEAAGGRERCRIPYLKPGANRPDERTIQPWAVAHAEGRWYCVARCERADGVRVFRLDRVLGVERTGDVFDPPDDLESALERYLAGGRVYHGGRRDVEARVRYSARIARWLAERVVEDGGTGGTGATGGGTGSDATEHPAAPRYHDDGSVVLTHRVADPDWLVRHVLAYAPDAEVLEPEEVRRQLAEPRTWT